MLLQGLLCKDSKNKDDIQIKIKNSNDYDDYRRNCPRTKTYSSTNGTA